MHFCKRGFLVVFALFVLFAVFWFGCCCSYWTLSGVFNLLCEEVKQNSQNGAGAEGLKDQH